jgi:hypothetical protein
MPNKPICIFITSIFVLCSQKKLAKHEKKIFCENEGLTKVKVLMFVCWIVMPCQLVCRYQHVREHTSSTCKYEDGGSMFLHNTGIYLKSLWCYNPKDQHHQENTVILNYKLSAICLWGYETVAVIINEIKHKISLLHSLL